MYFASRRSVLRSPAPPAPSSAHAPAPCAASAFFGCAHRENFHAAVAAVSHIPVHIQLAGGVLHIIPVANSLHMPRDHVATCDHPLTHNISSLPEPRPVLPNRRMPLPPLRYTGFQVSGGPISCRTHLIHYAANPTEFCNLQIRPRILLVAVAGSFTGDLRRSSPGKPRRPASATARNKNRTRHRRSAAEAPPSLPPAQIINSFTKKGRFVFRGAGRSTPIAAPCASRNSAPMEKPAGEYDASVPGGALQQRPAVTRKALAAPQSSLQYLQFEPDDAHYLGSVPAFPPLTTDQLSKYNVKFLGKRKSRRNRLLHF